MGVGGEAAALVVITLLAILGNALLVVTLLRRSLLHHPSNRLVLNLTASNLVLAVVVLPGMVASLMMGSHTTTTLLNPLPMLTYQNNGSLDLDSSNLSTAQKPEQHQQYLHDPHLKEDVYQVHLKNNSQNNNVKKQDVRSKEFRENVPQLKKGKGETEEQWERKNMTTRQKIHPLKGQQEEGWEAGQWPGSHVLCQGAAFFTNFVTAGSAITVAIVALDRYLAIVRPMVYGLMVTGNRCLLMLAWCWVQALLTALPPLLGWARYEHRGPEGWCGIAWSSSPSYTAAWIISVFLIPVIIMLVCYYFILQVARNKCRRIHVGTVLGSSSPPITPDPSSICLDGPVLADSLEPPLENGSGVPQECRLSHLLDNGPGVPQECRLGHLLENGSGVPLGNGSGPILGNTSSQPMSNGSGPHQLKNAAVPQDGLDVLGGQGLPCRSRSVSGMNRPQPVRPCLRRAQSSISMRPSTIRKKLSLAGRKPSWSWEASPAKGFRTVCVVVGTHVFTWAPYSALAVAEAVLGQEHSSLIPQWVMVTATMLLFTASVFYPIVYGLYNRSIRKEILACICPSSSRDRRRGSCPRRTSTLHSNTGSVLDFSSLRHRENEELQHVSLTSPSPGLLTVPIKTISGTLANPAVPSLPPILLLADYDVLPTRTYNINVRKPSQDSDCCLYELSPALTKKGGQPGAVMGSSDDPDSDMETSAPVPQLQQPTRRVSAPSILDTVCEDSRSTTVTVHVSSSNTSPSTPVRKLPILPLSSELIGAESKISSPLRRSHSLEKLTSYYDYKSHRDISMNNKISRSQRKKHSLPPMVKETQFITPSSCDRVQRRKGSVSVLKVMAIPEDSGILECPEVTDSGRGSVDSGEVKTRANRQISIDEGIGAECLLEEEGVSD